MRAFSGCPHCNYVERDSGKKSPGRKCPECGFALRAVDSIGQPLLSHSRHDDEQFRLEISATMVENARRARLTLR